MKRDLKTGIFLIFVGVVATIGLVVITGKQAIATNKIPNPAYGFGFCVYTNGGEFEDCYESVKRLHTDREFRRCMQETPYPAACLGNDNVIVKLNPNSA